MDSQDSRFLIEEIHKINENLQEQNRLLSEFLKYTLRHEGDNRKESAKDGD